MPLIIVTGLPSSGKSKVSKEIHDHFSERLKTSDDRRKLALVSDSRILDSDGRLSTFMTPTKEKELRGWIKTEVQRYMSLNRIVILDASAYIKGFRYELHCMAKEAKTQYCVIELLPEKDTCWQWNLPRFLDRETGSENPDMGYSRETFDALIMRYEPCEESNRWDTPLFKVIPPLERLDYDRIYQIICDASALTPNKCTSLMSTTTTIYKEKK